MKQIAILPSGNHVREFKGETLFFDQDRIFYASTLAIYVLNAFTFNVEKILPCGQKTISSMSVAPHDHNLIAVSCVDGFCCVWNVDEEAMVFKASVQGGYSVLWDPFSTTTCALVSREFNVLKVLVW